MIEDLPMTQAEIRQTADRLIDNEDRWVGFVLGVKAAYLHPEWAIAFVQDAGSQGTQAEADVDAVIATVVSEFPMERIVHAD